MFYFTNFQLTFDKQVKFGVNPVSLIDGEKLVDFMAIL